MSSLFLDFICALIINSLAIYGLFNAGTYKLRSDLMVIPEKLKLSMVDPDHREFLTGFRIWVENHLGPYYSKPIITCPMCMASVHSLIFYIIWFYSPVSYFIPPDAIPMIKKGLLISFPLTPKYLLLYPFYICSLAALNKAVKRIFVNE